MGKVIHLEWYKKLKHHNNDKWYMHKPESVLQNEMHNILYGFKIQTDHWIQSKSQNLIFIDKKKRISHLMDFVVPADHCVKVEEYEILKITRKKSWNIKMTVIPFVVRALGTVFQNLNKRLGKREIRKRIETIQTSSPLKLAGILWKVLES